MASPEEERERTEMALAKTQGVLVFLYAILYIMYIFLIAFFMKD